MKKEQITRCVVELAVALLAFWMAWHTYRRNSGAGWVAVASLCALIGIVSVAGLVRTALSSAEDLSGEG